jgi:PRC-barrel domain
VTGSSPIAGAVHGAVWRDRLVVRRAMGQELVSLANLFGCPVVDSAGARVGRVDDVVVRWERGVTHPSVAGVLVKVGDSLALIAAPDVTLTQTGVQLHRQPITVVHPTRHDTDVALARDVLDRQLVDVAGVQVVRAADVYLAKTAAGWEVAGIDIGIWALFRRLLPKRRTCPPPDRGLDWADLQAFVFRFPEEVPSEGTGPASAAGAVGSSMQTAYAAGALHTLRAKDVAALLRGLDRPSQAQLAALADTSTAAAALRGMEPAQLDAVLAELDEADRTKLLGLLSGPPP